MDIQDFYYTDFASKISEVLCNDKQYDAMYNPENFEKAKKFILHNEAASKIEMKNKILDFLKDNSAFIKLMNEDSFDEALKELLLEKLAVDYVRSVASKINEVENFK